MFEKCCSCNKHAGFSRLKNSGYAHPSSIQLLKLEDRWYVDRNDIWLCPHCINRERARDREIVRKREEQERLKAKKAEEAKFYNHPGPDDAVYREIWLWMKQNVGKKVKVTFAKYQDGHNLIPVINENWVISIPHISDDAACWLWSGCWSVSRTSTRTANVELELKTAGTYPGCHTAEVSREKMVYKIGYRSNKVYDSCHDETWYVDHIADHIDEVTGWTTYQMELQKD